MPAIKKTQLDEPLVRRLDVLAEEIKDFRKQYECDMRGENKVDGSIGLINEIRELKEYKEKYPSLSWLLAHKPVPTITAGVTVWLFIWSLTTVGLLKVLTALLGIPFP